MNTTITKATQKANYVAWVKALLSGKYKQGIGLLCKEKGGKRSYCCLGVACVVLGEREEAMSIPESSSREKKVAFFGSTAVLSKCQLEKLGITDELQNTLTCMNDEDRASFETIAALLERKRPSFFRKARKPTKK